ncbi:MAG: LysM domain [Verrucomicrobiota bacterium]|jgi:hypothetical protein
MKLIAAALTALLASSCSLTYSRTTYTEQGSRYEFGLLGSLCKCPKAPAGLLPLYVNNEIDRSGEDKHECDDRIEVLDHEVAPGDTLESIAAKYETTVESIQAFNPGLKELSPGTVIRVPVDGDEGEGEDEDEDCKECKK